MDSSDPTKYDLKIYAILAFTLVTLSVTISAYAAIRLKMKTKFSKTYFHMSMIAIVSGCVLSSVLCLPLEVCNVMYINSMNICNSNVSLYNSAVASAIVTYLMFFALLVGASFKYSIVRRSKNWKADFQAAIITVGFLLLVSTIIVQLIYRRVLFGGLVLVFYCISVDAVSSMLLLQKLNKIKSQCVDIPKQINLAYTAMLNYFKVFIVIFITTIIFIFVVIFMLQKIRSRMLIVFYYFLQLEYVIYSSLDVMSLILINKISKVNQRSIFSSSNSPGACVP
eukprot:NODE_303_length_11391_cov_0.177028.p4 type:complete len:281 gc:universal NODE_303_length_11391_cov_0.177028:9203-8361(-)